MMVSLLCSINSNLMNTSITSFVCQFPAVMPAQGADASSTPSRARVGRGASTSSTISLTCSTEQPPCRRGQIPQHTANSFRTCGPENSRVTRHAILLLPLRT